MSQNLFTLFPRALFDMLRHRSCIHLIQSWYKIHGYEKLRRDQRHQTKRKC